MIVGYIRLARPLNLFMVAIGVLVGYLVEWGFDPSPGIVLAPFAAIFATAGGNGLNDYFDRDVDKIAHPNRPIPSGQISPQRAYAFSIASFILAIVIALLTSWACLAIALINVGLMLLYEKRLKQAGLSGNLVISYLVASLFLFGGVVRIERSIYITSILMPLAFLATLGREIAKDVEDLGGDEGARLTLPMRIGQRRTSLLASGSILSAVVLSPLPYLLGVYGISYLYILIPADLLFVLSSILILRRVEVGEGLAKYAMLLGVGAFLGGAFL
jgi:geranylgeranylglycerol-phosphate geranylgeranyltransferase